MPNSSDPRLEVQRKPAVASLRLNAKADHKEVAVVDWRGLQAKAFRRVFELGGMTLHEVSHALGYRDQSQVSRWASAADRPQWDRIAEVPQLAAWIPVAWAEATVADVSVTVIVRKTA